MGSLKALILFFFVCHSVSAAESLSYSGRLVNSNGSPVAGPVTIKADLNYTDDLNASAILCTQTIPGVALTNGVFHVKLDFDCTDSGTKPTRTLTKVLSQTPSAESVAIKITDVTHSKPYSYQALHALPFANVASQLVQMGAGDGEFLKWDNGTKQWKPGTVSGASGGTVTDVIVSAPLSVSTSTSTPSITLPQASGTQSGYLSSADWTTFNNKEGTIAGGTASQFYRGDKSWQTLDTSAVPENASNLYFTNARVLGLALTGLSPTASAIVATDTVLEGFSKAQGQINTLTTDSSHFLKKDNTDSITGTVNVGVTGSLTITNSPVLPTDAANRQYVNTYADTKLSLSGGTLTGVLNLDSDLKIKGGSNYVTVRGHATSAAYNLILPQTAGSNGYVLQTDGSGNLSWINPSSVAAGSGTVNSGSITDGSIVDADINASAAIAQSKIQNLTTDLAGKVSTTLSNGNILVGSAGNVATAVTVSGDATISNTGALTLANTSVTAGTYHSVTVDAKGRVTGGTNPAVVTGVSVSAPITNSGTATAPIIGMPLATVSANGYLSSADYTTFNNKQDAITSSSTLNTGSVTTNLQGGLILNPYNTAAGNTGEIRFKELTAGGSEYTGFKAPDALGSNLIYTLPSANGSSGQVLTNNGSGVLSWTTVAISSSNLTGDIGGTIGANTIGAGKVTLTHLSATGTPSATTYLKGDNTWATFAADVRTSVLTGLSTSTNAVITAADSVLSSLGKLQKQISDMAVSAVGGDLSGNLPNPTVVKIQGKAVSSSAPSPGQVLRFNAGGTSWDPAYLLIGDLKSSVAGNLFPGTGCAVNQTLQYSVVADAFTCVNIDSLDAGKITTGTIAAARLPSSATYWSSATGGINYGSGNVGIGTSSPTGQLHINSASSPYTQSLLRVQQNGSFAAMPDYLANFQTYGNRATKGNGTQHGLYVQAGWDTDAHETEIARFSALTGTYLDVPRMVIKSNGNVGVGTTTPSRTFEVSAASTPAVRISTGGSTTSYSDIVDYASTQMLINKTAASGAALIDVSPIPSDGTSIAETRFFRLTNTTGQKRFIIHKGDGTSTADSQITVGGNSWLNSSGGNVGIGTTNPLAKMHLGGDSDFIVDGLTPFAIVRSTAYPATGVETAGIAYTSVGSAASTTVWPPQAGISFIPTENHSATNQGTSITFQTTPNGSTARAERMKIDQNGNVGIGTSSPSTWTGWTSLDVKSPAAGNGATLRMTNSSTDQAMLQVGSNGAVSIGTSFPVAGSPSPNNATATVDFWAGNAIRMQIGANGHVGMGTGATSTNLHVSSNNPGGYTIISNTNAAAGGNEWRWYSSSTGAPLGSNSMCFGLGFCIFNLYSTGNATLSGTLTQSSDVRLKREISSIPFALENVSKLDGVSYFWKDSTKDPGKQIGLIAQEVEKVFPEAVETNSSGFKSVAYQNLIAPVINAIKEIRDWMFTTDDRIQSLEKARKQDRAVIEDLKRQNEALKEYLCKKDPEAPGCN